MNCSGTIGTSLVNGGHKIYKRWSCQELAFPLYVKGFWTRSGLIRRCLAPTFRSACVTGFNRMQMCFQVCLVIWVILGRSSKADCESFINCYVLLLSIFWHKKLWENFQGYVVNLKSFDGWHSSRDAPHSSRDAPIPNPEGISLSAPSFQPIPLHKFLVESLMQLFRSNIIVFMYSGKFCVCIWLSNHRYR